MPEGARERILEKLYRSPSRFAPVAEPDFGVMEEKRWPREVRYLRLRQMMEAQRAEFVETSREQWPRAVHDFVQSQRLSRILFGPGTPEGRQLESFWPAGTGSRLVPYDQPVERMKEELFERIDAGFTTTRGGIAETGGVILWPSPQEPRLLSLVPPVHLALLDVERIHDTFWHVLREESWAAGMSPNALLISGPSKTADIEQTLAYGVHGPKRLIIFAMRSTD